MTDELTKNVALDTTLSVALAQVYATLALAAATLDDADSYHTYAELAEVVLREAGFDQTLPSEFTLKHDLHKAVLHKDALHG